MIATMTAAVSGDIEDDETVWLCVRFVGGVLDAAAVVDPIELILAMIGLPFKSQGVYDIVICME